MAQYQEEVSVDRDVFEFDSPEQQAETIRHMVTHPAWRGFFVPNMERRRDYAINLLCVAPEMRGASITDAELRARIATLNELLNDGIEKVLEWDTEKLNEVGPLEYEHNKKDRADLGHVGPI